MRRSNSASGAVRLADLCIKISDSFRSNVRKSLAGFLGGILLSYMVLFAMINHMELNVELVMWLGPAIAVTLTLGLAFNLSIQCTTLLILPQLFSKRGRAMLTAYVFVLTLSGPVANTSRNTAVIIDSMHCDQKLIKTAMAELYELVKKPFVAIKRAVRNVLRSIKRVLVKIRRVMERMQKLIHKILKVIEQAFSFLAGSAHLCNTEMGSPFDRCVKSLENAKEDCRIKLGPTKFLCEVTTAVRTVCYTVKFMDYICEFIDFLSHSALIYVKKRLEEFETEIRNMLYISVKFSHHFHFKTNSSKTMHQIGDEILADIHHRSRHVFLLASFAHLVSSLFFFWIVLKVLRYKSKFLTNDRYDNIYITKEFRQINEMRKNFEKETVLPLSWKEKRKYIELTSCMLTRSERFRILRSASFMLMTCLQVLCMILTDYCLYWLLATIRYYGRLQGKLQAPPVVTFNVAGEGIIAELVKGIVGSFSPFAQSLDIDPTPCLPKPSVPNFRRYVEIAFLLTLSWILLIFEPYGLRLRQIIMNRFYPDRARERAAWLYNNVLRRRVTFIKFARRNARRQFCKDNRQEQIGCLKWMRAKFNNNWICRKILGDGKERFCMLCACPFKNSKDLHECVQPKCFGKYCSDCFKDLQSVCPICMKPIEYGDLSDVSEEVDSSGDESKQLLKQIEFHDIENDYEKIFIFKRIPDRAYERTKFW